MTLKPDITVTMYGKELKFLHEIKDGSKRILEFHFSKNFHMYLAKQETPFIRQLRYKLKAWNRQRRDGRWAARYDKVVLLTQQDMSLWDDKDNMCFISNPLPFRSDKVSSLKNKRIIAVGRHSVEKGFTLLVDAFSLIASKFSDWELVIYGNGPYKAPLEDKIREYNLEKQVILHEPIPAIQNALLDSSILVSSSLFEGFGLVLIEAMECGLPCVAFDCECGPREIIENGENGFLVNNANQQLNSDSFF